MQQLATTIAMHNFLNLLLIPLIIYYKSPMFIRMLILSPHIFMIGIEEKQDFVLICLLFFINLFLGVSFKEI